MEMELLKNVANMSTEKLLSLAPDILTLSKADEIKAIHLLTARAIELRCKEKFLKAINEAKKAQHETLPNKPTFVIIKKDGGEAVSPERLADYIACTENYYFIQSQNLKDRRLFWYQNGVYKRAEGIVKGIIKEIISKYSQDLATVRVIDETYTQLSYNNDMHLLQSDELLNDNQDIICFENGILDLKTMTMDAHSPEYRCTNQIPCKWCSEPKETPIFDKFIDHLARGEAEAKQTLFEMLGAVVSNVPLHRFKKSLFLIGRGNSGKSQFIKLMQLLVGRENFCSLPFSKLEDRFQCANLYQKRLAADSDCRNANSKETSIFKEITGGDEMQAEEKNKAPFNFVFKGLYVIAANDLPLFGGDKGDHVYKRILPIKCGDSIPAEKQDKFLLEKLYSERQGIITKAIYAFKSAIDNNYHFTMGENSKNLLISYEIENDSTLMFFDECCIECKDIKSRITTAQMWQAFREWCILTGEHLPKRKDFTRTLARKYNVPEYRLIKKLGGQTYYPFTLKQECREELHVYGKI